MAKPKNRPYNPNAPRPQERVGDSRKRGPIPIRLRHPFIPREHGGGEGHRGAGWAIIRKEILKRDKMRSTISGFTGEQGKGLQVDHIQPFRYGGKNKKSNLRTTDVLYNWHADLAHGSTEKPRIRQRPY